MFIYILVVLSGIISINGFDYIDNGHCISVPYWQCKDDYSGLVEDIEGLMDVRNIRTNRENSSLYKYTNDFDVCCPVECGKRKIPSQEEIFGFRILGNNAAEFGEFPWMLGILEDKTYRCGASLLHPQVAITAAHCVAKQSRYTIRAGEWNWETTTEPLPHQDRYVNKIIPHPNFDTKTLENDIAILLLNKAFTLRENVGIMCLPKPSQQYDRKKCVVAGWGRNSNKKGTYQAILKKIELPIISKARCVKTLQDIIFGHSFDLHKSFICAGGEDKKDTCKGDGGSPLICEIKNQPDTYQQVGIVSWGLTCGVANSPGVYVNTEMFVEWIDDVLGSYGFDTTIYKYQ